MDIYQIWTTYNKKWSKYEILAFSVLLLLTVIVVAGCVCRKKINIIQAMAIVTMVIFLGIVFGSTVFTRTSTIRQYELMRIPPMAADSRPAILQMWRRLTEFLQSASREKTWKNMPVDSWSRTDRSFWRSCWSMEPTHTRRPVWVSRSTISSLIYRNRYLMN